MTDFNMIRDILDKSHIHVNGNISSVAPCLVVVRKFRTTYKTAIFAKSLHPTQKACI